MKRKSIAISLITLAGIVGVSGAAAAAGESCNPVVLNANKIAGLALLATALWHFIKAVPHMRVVRKRAGSNLFLFPIEKTRSLPEFGRMWRHLAFFYGAIFAYLPVLGVVEALGY